MPDCNRITLRSFYNSRFSNTFDTLSDCAVPSSCTVADGELAFTDHVDEL